MPAAVRCLDISHLPMISIDREVGVGAEPREYSSVGDCEALPADVHDRAGCTRTSIDPLQQPPLVFPDEARIHRKIGVHVRIEAIGGDWDLRRRRSNPRYEIGCQTHGRVHRDGDTDDIDLFQDLGIELLDCQVDCSHTMSPGGKGRSGRSNVQRLMAELVQGHQEDSHRSDVTTAAPGNVPGHVRTL